MSTEAKTFEKLSYERDLAAYGVVGVAKVARRFLPEPNSSLFDGLAEALDRYEAADKALNEFSSSTKEIA